MKKAWMALAGAWCVLWLATGCVKTALLNGQIKGTREGSAAVDTLSDFEIARAVVSAGLGQTEGMHALAPENTDALFLLTKGWTGAGFAFIEDDYEQAADADNESLSEYHRARARAAYERAIYYGVMLLESKRPGFQKAKANLATMKQYVAGFDKDDVLNLVWVGQAWLAKANVSKDDPAVIGELYVGQTLLERSVELDETAAFAAAHTALGAYHARTAMAELPASLKHFQRAIQLTSGKSLLPKFHLARTYYCMKGDKASYEKTMREILDTGDVLPEQRLQNSIAKRRARRYLTPVRMTNCGF
jgi:TRAP transporter T-component